MDQEFLRERNVEGEKRFPKGNLGRSKARTPEMLGRKRVDVKVTPLRKRSS